MPHPRVTKLFVVCVKELIYGETRLENESTKSSSRDCGMVRYRKSCEMAGFGHNNVASALTGDIPTQLLKGFDDCGRTENRNRGHYTVTSISRVVTVKGIPFSDRTSRHSLMAS